MLPLIAYYQDKDTHIEAFFQFPSSKINSQGFGQNRAIVEEIWPRYHVVGLNPRKHPAMPEATSLAKHGMVRGRFYVIEGGLTS